MLQTCYDCGKEFDNLSNHWNFSSCNSISYHDHQIEIIEGLLLGDGTITSNPPNSKFQIGSTNKEFLQHLQKVFGCFSGTVAFSESASDIAKRNRNSGFSNNAKSENYNDYYKFRTMADERLNSIRNEWYQSSKSIPDNFTLTHRQFKYWYVSDGSLKFDGTRAVNPSVNISNVSFNTDRCVELIQELGYDARSQSSNWIRITTEDSKRLLNNLGSPIPGFEYKWNRNS